MVETTIDAPGLGVSRFLDARRYGASRLAAVTVSFLEMSFASISFACLFLFVLMGRLTFGREKRGVSYFLFLLVASLVFYAWHIPLYLCLLLGVSLLYYSVAGVLSNPELGARRQ